MTYTSPVRDSREVHNGDAAANNQSFHSQKEALGSVLALSQVTWSLNPMPAIGLQGSCGHFSLSLLIEPRKNSLKGASNTLYKSLLYVETKWDFIDKFKTTKSHMGTSHQIGYGTCLHPGDGQRWRSSMGNGVERDSPHAPLPWELALAFLISVGTCKSPIGHLTWLPL